QQRDPAREVGAEGAAREGDGAHHRVQHPGAGCAPAPTGVVLMRPWSHSLGARSVDAGADRVVVEHAGAVKHLGGAMETMAASFSPPLPAPCPLSTRGHIWRPAHSAGPGAREQGAHERPGRTPALASIVPPQRASFPTRLRVLLPMLRARRGLIHTPSTGVRDGFERAYQRFTHTSPSGSGEPPG